MIIIGEKKMGRPTVNPRTEKIGFRLSKQEIEDIEKCAAAMGTQRVNAVTEGIRLLKKKNWAWSKPKKSGCCEIKSYLQHLFHVAAR